VAAVWPEVWPDTALLVRPGQVRAGKSLYQARLLWTHMCRLAGGPAAVDVRHKGASGVD
jgi:hypothetical protein